MDRAAAQPRSATPRCRRGGVGLWGCGSIRTPGSGAVWRTDQSPQMFMNTASAQVTAFMDPTVELRGPPRQGPTLHEWAHSSAATH
ncbi:FAD/NAD(P)-binding protein [Corynebacterium sp. 35RC1]|nr:FAD/NAD(P)-binding protein [Corynebacterium sp. 35RC1]